MRRRARGRLRAKGGCGAESPFAYSRTPTQTIVPVCGITRSRYLQASRGALQRRNARSLLSRMPSYLDLPRRVAPVELAIDDRRRPPCRRCSATQTTTSRNFPRGPWTRRHERRASSIVSLSRRSSVDKTRVRTNVRSATFPQVNRAESPRESHWHLN